MKETKFTRNMVETYAEKLLIGLTDEETNMVLEEFSVIDETINKINDIEGIEAIEPMTHCLDDFIYVLREDEVITDENAVEKTIANGPVTKDNMFVVPKTV